MRRNLKPAAGVFALLLLLGACSGPSVSEISGTVDLGFAPASLGQAEPINFGELSLQANALAGSVEAEFVPGEVIVKFRPEAGSQTASALSLASARLERVRPLGLERAALYRAPGATAQATLAFVRELEGRPDVLYAQPNYIARATAVPNDTYYSLQWHYPAIKLPQAWDIETGSSNPVTVAVIDTGILSLHPDFAGKILPGYDFISDPTTANDGDGRDSDPEDTGDNPTGQSSYHGSHVAGTVAAKTNNSLGVAGVSWGAKILPVRVLGVGGGTFADIVDGILWSAGLSVAGAPANPNPAKVLNLSLGAATPCSNTPAVQDAFDQAFAQGAVVVVAAGNGAADANLYSPASCTGVITVGATEFRNYRSYYSNYGSRIDVMAPGGDLTANRNGDAYADGVLSAWQTDDANGDGTYGDKAFRYDFKQGTSMASPHVAGLVALLKSKKPSLTRAEIITVLKSSARPLSATACQGGNLPSLTGADCGAGLVDAQVALQAILADLNGTRVIACFWTGSACDPAKSKQVVLSTTAKSASYKLSSLAAGNYYVLAWKDVNSNGSVDHGDYYGGYLSGGSLALVSPTRTNISFSMDIVQVSVAAADVPILTQVLPLLR